MPQSRDLQRIIDSANEGMPSLGEVALLSLAARQLIALRKVTAEAIVACNQSGNPPASIINLEDFLMGQDATAELLQAARDYKADQAELFPREQSDDAGS